MTTERRLDALEIIVANHEKHLAVLTEIAERQQVRIEQNEAMLLEIRREAAMTKRLWTRLAQRYGWLEDEDLA